MAITKALRLNMTGLASSPAGEALRYQTAIDMAAYADQIGSGLETRITVELR